MPMEKLRLVMLACIAAFSCAPTCFASPKGRLARRFPLAHAVGVRDLENVSFPITQAPAPPLDPFSISPNAAPTPVCTTYTPCNIFYQYVSIFYWPSESQNTACLATMPSPTDLNFPSDLTAISPSIYAIFPSIMASDGCNQIGNTYGPITTSFAPSDLSTIDITGVSSNVFNFADLPCGPPGMDLPSGSSYAPLISPPPFIKNLDTAFANCIPGYSQGVDPPIGYTTVGGIAEPVPGVGGHPRRDLGAHPYPPMAPWAPARTAAPAHNGQL